MIRVEPKVIFPNDRDFTRVVRPVPASAFAVVVGGVRIQAGAFIIRVAFGSFGWGFFFGFPFFGPFAFQRFLLPFFPSLAREGDHPRPPPRRFAPFPRLRSPSQHDSTMGGAPLRFLLHLPRLRGPLFFGFAVRAAATA